MATATERRYTPDDLLKITDRPMPELIDGQLVERPLGQEADSVATTICWLLHTFARDTLPGLVNGSGCGFQIFPDDPEKVRIPSASLTRRDRLPGGRAAEGHARVAPDVVAEVVFPAAPEGYHRDKVQDFLGAGVPWVWLVDPESRSVDAYRADGSRAHLGPDDFLVLLR